MPPVANHYRSTPLCHNIMVHKASPAQSQNLLKIIPSFTLPRIYCIFQDYHVQSTVNVFLAPPFVDRCCRSESPASRHRRVPCSESAPFRLARGSDGKDILCRFSVNGRDHSSEKQEGEGNAKSDRRGSPSSTGKASRRCGEEKRMFHYQIFC